jgi:aryl-alcohol dehydrogenase-like predicted oxidoreductase
MLKSNQQAENDTSLLPETITKNDFDTVCELSYNIYSCKTHNLKLKRKQLMTNDKLSRRTFIHNTSMIAAGSIAAAYAGTGSASTGKKNADTSKILNYNPKMRYRRLGKTNFMVSEISLGGHWANRGGGRYWSKFANDEVPGDVVKNRTEVVSSCIDNGINYLDITTAAECLSYGAALKGRREKMIVAADDCDLSPQHKQYTNVKSQLHNIDECLRRFGTDYFDIWRPMFRQDGKHTDSDLEITVEAFEKAREKGKARFLGMTSHNRDFIQHLVENFSRFSVVYFPYTAKSKTQPADVKSVDPKQVVEIGTGDGAYSGDIKRGIFGAAQKHDIGVVTIKPFAGGSLFRTRLKFGTETDSTEQDYERARLTLAYILCNPAITATIPGMTTTAQVDNNVRASAERLALLDNNGIRKLTEATEQMWADLPDEYRWLHDWEWV